MKKSLFFVLCMVIAGLGFAQTQSPVKWTYAAKKKSAGIYEVTVRIMPCTDIKTIRN